MSRMDAPLLRVRQPDGSIVGLGRKAVEQLLAIGLELKRRRPWIPQQGPQTQAYNCEADITGFGGSAGGGKTDLVAGLALTRHKRALILRREKAQTEGFVQRITEIVGDTTGFNSQKSVWRLPIGSKALIEFGGLDNPGDERRWQGRAHDLKAFDEATEMREAQVRFIMGWTRTNDPKLRPRIVMTFNPPTTSEGRWVIKFFGPWLEKGHPNPAAPGELRWFTTKGDDQDYEVPSGKPFVWGPDGEPLYDFERKAYRAEDIVKPKSRTFIPARLTDNKYYMATDYMAQLQSLPEPLRSQMLYGDFQAGMEDDIWQVIPTAWVEAAQARWKPLDVKPPMDSMGVDVARGGKDKTVISRRHGQWYDELVTLAGSATPDGHTTAGQVLTSRRNNAPIHIDVIGVGASPYDILAGQGQQVIGVNVAEGTNATDKSGRLKFQNQRSELWWRLREALDPEANTGIALPPDPRLLADLTAPRWQLKGYIIAVESREDIVKRIGRSPDFASAVILAQMDTPSLDALKGMRIKSAVREYDPYS